MDVTEPSEPRPRTAAELLADPEFQVAIERLRDRRRRPLLAVLDTSFVRSGLAHQLKSGRIPASLDAVQDKTVRVFMEQTTLEETARKLPEFAQTLGVSEIELRRLLNEHWLPHVRVVRVPDKLRGLDPRATQVREKDPDDYPAGALGALLSPCMLLTHNWKDFRPLGVRNWTQAQLAVGAAVDVEIGERKFQAVVMTPALPVYGVGAGVKWAADKIGPIAWLLAALVVAGCVAWYRNQPDERKRQIKEFAGDVGNTLMEEAGKAAELASAGQDRLDALAVPAPDQRCFAATVLRELALRDGPTTAQELHDALDDSVRPSVEAIREFLRAHKGDLFEEPSRGRFVVGRYLAFRMPVPEA